MGLIRFPELFLTASLKPFLQLIEYLLVFLCVVNLVKFPKDVKKYVKLEVFCGLILASITLYEAYFGTFTFKDQPIFLNTYYIYRQELKINPSLMLLLIPTFWFIIFFIRKRPYLIGFIPLFLYVFILSSSRSLYLGVLGGIVGMLYLRNISKIALLSIIGFIIVWFNLDILAPKVNEIFESIFGYFTNPYDLRTSSTVGRLILIKIALSMFLKHPLWGYGINGFGMEFYSTFGLTDYGRLDFLKGFLDPNTPCADTHNQYLQILADHGIVALILFSYLIVKVMKISLNNYKKANDPFLKDVSGALFVSLVSFLFAFLGVVILETDNNITPMIFWFNIGLIYSIKRMVENNGNKDIKPSSI
jgi:O-antigen ligase